MSNAILRHTAADVDSITFDDIAAREVAASGELQATQTTPAHLRDTALTAISWLANWRTGLASIDELDVRMNALKQACDTAEKPALFGANALLRLEMAEARLTDAHLTIDDLITDGKPLAGGAR